jgi:hypothetical protein
MSVTVERAEKRIKKALESYLNAEGWKTEIAWGSAHGIDIHAQRDRQTWVIEVKTWEDLDRSPIDSFVSVLGEILQRMDDPHTKYSIALPDVEPLRRLWGRLPELAKARMGITALFVDPAGAVTELSLQSS